MNVHLLLLFGSGFSTRSAWASTTKEMAPQQTCDDETGRTDVTFSEGYIPELIDDQRDRVALFDMRMADAMIQYDELRQGLRELQQAHGSELAAAQREHVEGECCVCLDELGHACDVTKVGLCRLCGCCMRANAQDSAKSIVGRPSACSTSRVCGG